MVGRSDVGHFRTWSLKASHPICVLSSPHLLVACRESSLGLRRELEFGSPHGIPEQAQPQPSTGGLCQH